MVTQDMINSARRALDELKGRRKLYQDQLEAKRKEKKDKELFLLNAEKARMVVQVVAESTMKTLEIQIGSLVSTALAAIFSDPYQFLLRFEQRRGRTEADMLFVKNGKEADPLTASGGGAVDVAAFALRPAIGSIRKGSPVLILDETFKFLSPGLHEKASKMMKMLCDKLGLQILLISHSREIIASADRVFHVHMEGGQSIVEEVQK